MTAAEVTETYVGGLIGGAAVKTGVGMVMGIYTVTKAAQNDWVIFGDFTQVYHAYITVAGAHEDADIDGTTLNKVTLTSATTGACIATVFGTKA